MLKGFQNLRDIADNDQLKGCPTCGQAKSLLDPWGGRRPSLAISDMNNRILLEVAVATITDAEIAAGGAAWRVLLQ